jgi:hypothetical protein
LRETPVARIFAGVFGPLAFLTSLARGAVHGGSAESTLLAAWYSLLVFSAIGYVIGWAAGATIEQSLRATVAAELAAREAAQKAETPSGRQPEGS